MCGALSGSCTLCIVWVLYNNRATSTTMSASTMMMRNNPILASAFASHGALVDGCILGGGSVTGSTTTTTSRPREEGRGGSGKRTTVRALSVHPLLPRVAYLEEEFLENGYSDDDGGGTVQSSKSARRRTGTAASGTEHSTKNGAAATGGGATGRLVIRRASASSSPPIDNESHMHRNNNTALVSISTMDLYAHIDEYRRGILAGRSRRRKDDVSNDASSAGDASLLGKLISLTFLDDDAMYWTTRRMRGTSSNLDMSSTMIVAGDTIDCNPAGAEGGGHFDDFRSRGSMGGSSSASYSNTNATTNISTTATVTKTAMGGGLCLGLQFERGLVLSRFDHDYDGSGTRTRSGMKTDANTTDKTCTILCCLEGQRADIVRGVGGQHPRGTSSSGGGGHVPTSPPLPISASVFVYGCSDGAMRYHDLSGISSSSTNTTTTIGRKPSTTIKSVRGPNGRNDPVVRILNVDPAYWNDDDIDDDTISTTNNGGGDGGDAMNKYTNTRNATSDHRTLVMRSRILTVCGSGVAFLWEVRVSIDRSTGSLRDLAVLPVSVLI
jgi:hypothetical protein